MRLEIKKLGRVTVVRSLESRMDAKVANDFKTEIGRIVEEDNRWIVFDVSEIAFIDSSGLGAIVSSLKMLGNEGDLVIAGAGETVLSLFKLTRMDRVFQMFATEKEAVESLAG
jgi:anti-sigma B factor antagonist